MEPWPVTVASLLANLRDPQSAFPQNFAVDPFGHKQDTRLLGACVTTDLLNFLQVIGARDDKLQLIWVFRHQAPQDVRLITQTLLLGCPSAAFARKRDGVLELGTDAHEIARHWRIHGAGGLNRNVGAGLAQPA